MCSRRRRNPRDADAPDSRYDATLPGRAGRARPAAKSRASAGPQRRPNSRRRSAGRTTASRRGRPFAARICRGRVAAPPRPRRGHCVEMSCGDDAAATWTFRVDESRRRGCDVDIPRRRVAATTRLRRGNLVETGGRLRYHDGAIAPLERSSTRHYERLLCLAGSSDGRVATVCAGEVICIWKLFDAAPRTRVVEPSVARRRDVRRWDRVFAGGVGGVVR